MHLKYFGTAAAEGIPGMFCTCAVCRESLRLGGRNLRTRSQALVDGRLLIDFPPDTYGHMLRGGLDLPSIHALLITHAHQDHLYAQDFENRKPGFAYVGDAGARHETPLRVYATAKAMEHVRTEDRDRIEERGITQLHEIAPFEPFTVDDFVATAMTADHGAASGPVIYAIERAGAAMLYANDTGFFPEETWEYLAGVKPYFSFVSLDCTGMIRQDYRRGHMALPANAEVRDRLIALGCADENTIFCAHHFSHNGGLTHGDLVNEAAKIGFLVSYDGMEIEF
ncbi:MAG: MBL fold metallo-hydrolase [Oscillospiraceae bacterium]|nr:MBL fold metallo-hydrolase [Oscillospiraceae bacterium]